MRRARRALTALRVLRGEVAHEVEEVAGLLDERAACIRVEPVPVAHLAQEREAVLAQAEHAQPPNRALAQLVGDSEERRHVPVLHPHPKQPALVSRLCLVQLVHLEAVVERRAQRLLAQDVLASRDRVTQHIDVRVVGRGDDDDVDVGAREEVGVGRIVRYVALALLARPSLLDQRLSTRARGLVWVGDGSDHSVRVQPEVLQMLATDAACADHAKAERTAPRARACATD
mmetsp:Transcript_23924/g.61635  ORF Transcript_23924/g.61635 Transcript_23924/m.61635 type:complete len:230 (+) Transcript_23924:816-1505(+)